MDWFYVHVIVNLAYYGNRWQTLIAGGLAFLGALWTVGKIREQIQQTAELEKTRRLREELAAKAVMPMALAELCQYGRDCINLLVSRVSGSGEPPFISSNLVAPRVPGGVIQPLQAVARNADPPIREQISILLSKLQLQNGRLQSLVARTLEAMPAPISVAEGKDCIVNAADLMAYGARLFGYARDTEGARKLCTADELVTAMRNSGVWEHDRAFARINKRTSQQKDER